MSLVLETNEFKYGVVDQISAYSIPRGAASASLNWLTKGDSIELRRGSIYLGTNSVQAGNGKASGIKKLTDALGVEHLVGTYGQKAVYFDIPTAEWIEIVDRSTGLGNILGAKVVSASGIATEEISIEEYVGLAGNQAFINSPSCAGLWKLMTANLGNAVNMYDSQRNFNGYMKIDSNRMFLWGTLKDQTGIYGSWIDTLSYTTVTNENSGYVTNGATKIFTGKKLAQATSNQTIFAVQPFGQIAAAVTINTGISTASPHATVTASGHGLAVGDKIYFENVGGMTQINSLFATVVTVVDANNFTIDIDTSAFGAFTSGGDFYKVELFTDNYDGTLTSNLGGSGTIDYVTGALSLTFNTAPIAPGAAVTPTGTTNSSNQVTTVSSMTGVAVGDAILDTGNNGIPVGTTITAISGTTLTISQNATAGNSGTALSITAPGTIPVVYQYENSANEGVCDFNKEIVENVRVAGSGFVFRQDEGGGPVKNIKVYASVYFCMHLKKTWELNLGSDDTTASNLPYRQNVGAPSRGGSIETGQGIYYIDDQIQQDQRIRILTFSLVGSNEIIPVALSNNIKIDEYLFDQAQGIEWGDYIFFAIRTQDSPVNNRVLAYNKIWKSWDILDYDVSCFEIYNGQLVGGDAFSNNFAVLFSGFDDNGDQYENYWIGMMDTILLPGLRGPRKFLLHGVKQVYEFYLRGLIQTEQKLKVSISYDDADFVEIGCSDVVENGVTVHHYAIEGTGTYVDTGRPVDIGGATLGTQDIGGVPAAANPTVYANPYERRFLLKSGEFEKAQIKFEAIGLGFVSVTSQKWWDVRLMGNRTPVQYTDRM